jgi:hypothetical protein
LNEDGKKLTKLSRIIEGLARFKSDGMPLASGLHETVLSKDFDLCRCLDMFGLKSTLEETPYLLLCMKVALE